MNKISKIIVISGLVFFLSGCFGMSVKNYIEKIEPQFNQVVTSGEKYGNVLNDDSISTSEKTQKNTNYKKTIVKAKMDTETMEPPKKAQNLHLVLVEYYSELDKLLGHIENLLYFTGLSEEFVKNNEEAFSDSNTELSSYKSDLKNYKIKTENQVKDLENKNLSVDFDEVKQSILDMLNIAIDFSDSMIKAIDAGNADSIDAGEYEQEIDSVYKNFNKAFNDLQNEAFSEERLNNLSNLEGKIKQYLNELK